MMAVGQTTWDILRDIRNMEAASDCVVVYAERVGGDVIIEFNDGKYALYSASFLHSMLTEATQLDTSDFEDE
jgi:hypothetical protein